MSGPDGARQRPGSAAGSILLAMASLAGMLGIVVLVNPGRYGVVGTVVAVGLIAASIAGVRRGFRVPLPPPAD